MSSAAVGACTLKTGDAGTCETAALLGATDLQLESVTDEFSLENLLTTPQLTGNPLPSPSVSYVPSTSTVLVGSALGGIDSSFVTDPAYMDALAQVVEPTSIAKAVNQSVTDTGDQISSAASAVSSSVGSFLSSNIIWIVIILGILAVVAAIILNPEGLARAARAAFGS